MQGQRYEWSEHDAQIGEVATVASSGCQSCMAADRSIVPCPGAARLSPAAASRPPCSFLSLELRIRDLCVCVSWRILPTSAASVPTPSTLLPRPLPWILRLRNSTLPFDSFCKEPRRRRRPTPAAVVHVILGPGFGLADLLPFGGD